MEDLLISVLQEIGYPVMLQGSLLPDEPYPDNFFTFWNNSSEDSSFYDNAEHSTIYRYTICFYSISPSLVYSKIREAKAALKSAGFVVHGDGYSVPVDEQTHDGRGIDIFYFKYIGDD